MTTSIGEVAERTGLSIDTLRYYDRIGLVRPSRDDGGRRAYRRNDVARLDVVVTLRGAGLSLDEIARVMRMKDSGASTGARLDDLRTLLEEVRARVSVQRDHLGDVLSMVDGWLLDVDAASRADRGRGRRAAPRSRG